MHIVLISGYELDFKNMLKIVSSNDSKYNKLMKKCTKRPGYTKDSAYQIDIEGFLCFKNQIYIPNQSNIKQIIFKELHDNPCAGHPRYHKLITNFKKYFYWPI